MLRGSPQQAICTAVSSNPGDLVPIPDVVIREHNPSRSLYVWSEDHTGLGCFDLSHSSLQWRGHELRLVVWVSAGWFGLEYDELRGSAALWRVYPVPYLTPSKAEIAVAYNEAGAVVGLVFVTSKLPGHSLHRIGPGSWDHHTLVCVVDRAELGGDIGHGLREGARHQILGAISIDYRVFFQLGGLRGHLSEGDRLSPPRQCEVATPEGRDCAPHADGVLPDTCPQYFLVRAVCQRQPLPSLLVKSTKLSHEVRNTNGKKNGTKNKEQNKTRTEQNKTEFGMLY